jgi:hypothetical protein
MKLIDVEKIDFCFIKDPLERAAKEIITKIRFPIEIPDSLAFMFEKEEMGHEKDILR